jgi:hypothetical protein
VTAPRSDEELIRLAGFDPRTARVVARTGADNAIVALIDTNGDDRLVELQTYWADPQGRWHPGSSVGAGSRGEGGLADGRSYVYERTADGWRLELNR